MFDASSLRGDTPHQITRTDKKGAKQPQLINLVHQTRTGRQPGTTRVIRVYQQTGSKVDIADRIDWEIKKPESGWLSKADLKSHVELCKVLASDPPDAVVVKDLLKGAVSSDLIGFLASKLGKVPWFISSKTYRPGWPQFIERESIRLLEIPQAAAQDAVDKGPSEKGLDAWLTPTGKPSKHGLKVP